MRSAMPSSIPDRSTATDENTNKGPRDVQAQPTRRRVGWTELYIEPLLIVLAAMSVALIFTVVLRPPAKNEADFYIFWDAARWYREGVDPYLGHSLRPGAGYNLNAPALIFLFLPFSYMPLRPAFAAWTLVGLLACTLAARWIARALAIRSPLLLLCVLLISQATFIALQLGQLTALLLPLFTWAWVADRNKRPWTAGVLLGVLIAAKPLLGLFGMYALLFRRSRPLVLGIAWGAAALWGLGLLAGGISVYRSWLFVLGQVTWPADPANGSLLAVITRELTTPPTFIHATPLAIHPGWVSPIWFLALVVVGGVALSALRRITDIDQAWLLVGVCSFLLSPLGWAYYAPLLAGPAIARWQTGQRFTRLWLALGYAFFCMPFTVLVSIRGATATILFGSAYTWGLLAWYLAAVTPGPRVENPNAEVGRG
jgi:Glycosyltransferase family 87